MSNSYKQQQPAKKVLISKNPQSDGGGINNNQNESNRRVAHACEPCRHRKTKCDGRRPTCSHCERFLFPCQYLDGKREKSKRRMKELEEKVQMYERILQDLQGGDFGNDGQATVLHALSLVSPSSSNSQLHDSTTRRSSATPVYDGTKGNDRDSGGSVEHLVEDINTVTINQPMGYMGRGSEVAWLRLLRAELDVEGEVLNTDDIQQPNSGIGGVAATNITCTTYHMDDLDLSLASENGQVNTYYIPSKPHADELVYAYFESVNQSMPTVNQEWFMEQYNVLYENGNPFSISSQSLTIINLVFAIGGRYYESMGKDMDCGHLDYLMRARILGALDGGTLFRVATLHDVQALALTGMYLLSSKHTNRWNVVGLAVRLAHGLGLNLRNDDPVLTVAQREMRVRTWYSIVYLEATLCLVTGRPSGIQTHSNLGPIPSGPQNPALAGTEPDPYYAAVIKLCMITGTIQSELDAARQSEASVMDAITKYHQAKLDNWRAHLPDVLDFTRGHEPRDVFMRKRIDLAFRHHNALIILNFPNFSWVDNAAGNSRCLASALSILSVITHQTADDPEMMPWWCYLHYLVTAEAILMLTMVHGTGFPQLMEPARMPLPWLGKVGRVDLASRRTFEQLTRLLESVEEKGMRVGKGVQDRRSSKTGLTVVEEAGGMMDGMVDGITHEL